MRTGCSGIPRDLGYRAILLVLVIGSLGLYLRTSGNSFGLPFGDYADEAGIPVTAARIVGSGDWNPHYFNYPPLTVYSIAVITSTIRCIEAMETSISTGLSTAELAHRIGRWLSAFYGLGCIFSVFFIAYLLFDYHVGLIAAMLMAVQPTLVFHSHLATVDMSLIFWMLSTSAFLALFVIEGKHLHVFIAAITTGIATAVKYNGISLLVPVGLLFLLFSLHKGYFFQTIRWFLLRSVVLIFLAAITFLVLAPYTILDFDNFARDFLWEMNHQKVGHYAIDSMAEKQDVPRLRTLFEHASTIWRRLGAPVVLVLLVGLFFIIRERMVHQGAFFMIPLVLCLSISWSKNAPERYTMLLFPFLIILASFGVTRLCAKFRYRRSMLLVFLVLLILPLFGETTRMLDVLRKPQTPSRVRNWFFSSVPVECGIAADIYAGVWVNAARTDHVKLPSLSYRSPTWYREHGISFLVLSSLIRERDHALFARDAWRRQFYDWLPRSCHWIARFEGISYDLLNPTIDVFIVRPDEQNRPGPQNAATTMDVSFHLDRKPTQRLTILWDGRTVFNDLQQKATITLPFFPGRPCEMLGIVFFKGGEPENADPVTVSLWSPAEGHDHGCPDRDTNPQVEIFPRQGIIRPGEPFVFRLRTKAPELAENE